MAPWVCAFVASVGTLASQTLMQRAGPSGVVRIFNTDSAILESKEVRKDLPCSVEQIKPVLGFDLKYHAGYEVAIPLKELAGSENLLTMIFRVTPQNRPEEPVYFSQRVTVPSIETDAKGEAYLQGAFELGEGKYSVDWLMRDRSERVCSSNWSIEVNLPENDKQMALDIAPSTIQPSDRELFRDEPPVHREQPDGPLNVKIIMNFAPQKSHSATLQPLDTNALLSILRNIAREPRIGKFSIVAFNMQQQKVIYRQEDASEINFPSLGRALETLNLGTVDLGRLSQKHGDTDFLANLVAQEVNNAHRPDAVIFAGPKVMLDSGVPQESLKQIGELSFPVFYMNYNLTPQNNPWRDGIGNIVKYLKGAEYTISRPRDLWFAWSDIMSRIVKLKIGRNTVGASSQ